MEKNNGFEVIQQIWYKNWLLKISQYDGLQEDVSSTQEVNYLKYLHLSVDSLVHVQERALSSNPGELSILKTWKRWSAVVFKLPEAISIFLNKLRLTVKRVIF